MKDLQDLIADCIPKPIVNVATEIVDGEVLLYHPEQTRAVYLNSTAAVVWGLCDRNRSVRDIVRLIAESYPDASESLADDVLLTLKRSWGVRRTCGRLRCDGVASAWGLLASP